MKISEKNLGSALEQALAQASQALNVSITYDKDRELEPRSPIFLQTEDGRKLGVTHFMKTPPECETLKFEDIARTIDELKQSIIDAYNVNKKASDEGVLINGIGVALFSKGVEVEIDAEGNLVLDRLCAKTSKGEKILASRVCGEGGLTFSKIESGDIQASDPYDQRKGKGMFFTKMDRTLYRA